WNLRMTGITIANSASCGYEEHQHAEDCWQEEMLICEKQEHIHQTGCYSNPKADVETSLDWQRMFADYPHTGVLREDLVGIAKTQVGYAESSLNFEVSDTGERKGYTRYGAWYGAPYNDWSAMFVSFCLSYAGADPTEFPNSSGASAMAKLWKAQEKYMEAGEYLPQSGDLVFFNDNTVGIVSEVYEATFYVIRGDTQNAVVSESISLNDSSIVGWGTTQMPVPEEEPTAEETEPTTEETEPTTEGTEPEPEDLLDISDGPAFFIIVGSEPQRQRFSLRSTRASTELIPYLEANGGSYFYTLLDLNNVELPKDENGNYIAEAQKGYKLTITFNSPNGFLPGTYQYQIPNGLMVDGGEGEFILKDNTNVGSWVVTDTGLITLVFNEHMNSRTDIIISSTLGIHFPEQEDPIDFDGFITVKVEPPIQQVSPTVLSKWGSPDADAGKIHWSVRIDGYADSQIPGSILTDQPALSSWSKPHSYTQSDIDGGLNFGVSDPNGGWHNWTVSADDPHLIWDETGWSYKIPKTVICDYCGELELGNEGWSYIVDYTSTPTRLNTPGTFDYENKVTVDGQTAWGWSNFTHGKMEAEVVKNGSFVSDANGGAFQWEIQVTIPGRVEGQRAEYSWFIMDEMRLLDDKGTAIGRVQNDSHLSKVIATYNGTVIEIPRIQDATAQDMFAWDNSWTATEGGISYNRTLNLLCRCQCTAETCHWTGCGDYWFQTDDGTWATKGFCQCWTETQNMTFTFVYKTEDLSKISDYGSLGYQVNNLAQLYYMPDSDTSVRVSYDDAAVTIPNLFEKQLTQDFNGYTAHYKITVNEAKMVLTNGSPLYIHDVMTDTLAYISGSLVITTENANGHTGTLQQGVDYTVTYDGTGEQTDLYGKKVHVLDIVILNPQPVMYTLNYDTTLIMPGQITGGVKYSNSANITLWGEKVTDSAIEKVYADINIAAKSYAVELFKNCSLTGKPLPGATFGLYNAQGGLISSGITDADGRLTFQTNIVEGIILQEHVLYYLQEIKPPPAYRLDDTKQWFFFCNETGEACDKCKKLLLDMEAIRIPFEEIGLIRLANDPAYVELPATGGIGTPIYVVSGFILVLGPFIYGFSLRRRFGRRLKD
ncbi:MAG: LPXTG cell wall anchor domain-containing protein, partial [Lachnospiraceae bacterium]|nr:LPXTG cell wall anchor domain-containing protein [Lachnospiraceae bacterium]